MRVHLTSIIGACAALLAPGTAIAQSPGEDADFAWIVELLDSPNWAVRESATAQLKRDRNIGLREIEALIRREDVSAEARLRLSNAAKERFMRSTRAAVGMGPLDTSTARMGVSVGRLQSGFDAERVLRVGDRIVRAQGRPVRDWNRFRALILSNDPGDIFEVLVIRDGEPVELEFRLGHYTDLQRSDPNIDVGLLEEAWQIRMSDATSSEDRFGDSASSGYHLQVRWDKDLVEARSSWPHAERATRRIGLRRTTNDEPSGIEAAGHQATLDLGRLQQVRRIRGLEDEDRFTDEVRLDIWKRHLEEQLALMDRLRKKLDDPETSDQARRSVMRRIERMTPAIEHIKRWIAEEEADLSGG